MSHFWPFFDQKRGSGLNFWGSTPENRGVGSKFQGGSPPTFGVPDPDFRGFLTPSVIIFLKGYCFLTPKNPKDRPDPRFGGPDRLFGCTFLHFLVHFFSQFFFVSQKCVTLCAHICVTHFFTFFEKYFFIF